VLAESATRCILLLHNASNDSMYLEFGVGAAHATLTSGAVSAVTVDNSGFGFTSPPMVRFLGGGGSAPALGINQPGGLAPSNVATAHAVLSGNSIGSIVVDNGGALYQKPPYVQLIASNLDPYGAATPAAGQACFSRPATPSGSTRRLVRPRR
jgi:hypothetical protein